MGGRSFYRLTAPYAEHIAVIIWRVTSPLNIRPSAVANLHMAAVRIQRAFAWVSQRGDGHDCLVTVSRPHEPATGA